MPYIEELPRTLLDPMIDNLADSIKALTGIKVESWAGLLNYTVTRLLVRTLPSKRYWTMALGIGTLICVIFEFYRRFVGPYEDVSITKNGDIKEYK